VVYYSRRASFLARARVVGGIQITHVLLLPLSLCLLARHYPQPLSKAAAVDAPMDSLADLASSPPVARTPSQKKKKPKKDSTATPTTTSSAAKKKSSQTPSGSSKAKKKSSQTPSGSSSSAAKKKSSQTPGSSSKAKAKASQTPSNSSTEAKPNQTPKSSTTKAKASQTPSSSGKSSKTYTDMIHEAIVALQDRTGSSVPAIKKYMLAEFPTVDGPHFKNRFATGLKSGIKTERFVKLKCSYKISAAFRNKLKAKRKKVAAQAKRKSLSLTVEQRNKQRMEALQKKDLTPEELAKAKADMAAKVAAEKRRQALERQQRERAERIRRRRFPMEDHKLHLEDKELNVKPPPDVTSRPHLPWFWHMTLPLEDPARKGKTSDSVLRHSKVENADVATRGLVPDLLQVYHFFSGTKGRNGVPAESFPLGPTLCSHYMYTLSFVSRRRELFFGGLGR
jgi:histone H1/5